MCIAVCVTCSTEALSARDALMMVCRNNTHSHTDTHIHTHTHPHRDGELAGCAHDVVSQQDERIQTHQVEELPEGVRGFIETIYPYLRYMSTYIALCV